MSTSEKINLDSPQTAPGNLNQDHIIARLKNARPQGNDETLELAKFYLSLGFCTLPVSIGTKKPSLKWKEFEKRLPTLEQLNRWFSRPNTTFGFVTGKISNITVVDLDSDAALDWGKRNLPQTFFRTKTKKGEHWYYRFSDKSIWNKNAAKFRIAGNLLHLDIRSDGGFIMGPGAIHPDGIYYEFAGGLARV